MNNYHKYCAWKNNEVQVKQDLCQKTWVNEQQRKMKKGKMTGHHHMLLVKARLQWKMKHSFDERMKQVLDNQDIMNDRKVQ